MKLLHFRDNGCIKLGVATTKGVIDAGAAFGDPYREELGTVDSLLAAGESALRQLAELANRALDNSVQLLRVEELELEPCVLAPSKFICIGLNYRKHAEETNSPIPEFPIVFNKFPNALTAHKRGVPMPSSSLTQKVDYESELGIVIGRTGSNVSEEQALDYVTNVL